MLLSLPVMGREQESSQAGRRAPAPAVVAALLMALSLGCATTAHRRALDQDRLLSGRVGDALAATTPGGSVEGRAYHGVVALLGEVPTEQVRSRAETAARAVPGVIRVNNLILIEVEGDSSKAEGSPPVQGAPITARAETAPAS